MVKDGRRPSHPFLVDGSPFIFSVVPFVAIVAQLVRAPACGAGGRRFESGLSPHLLLFFLLFWVDLGASYPKVSEKLDLSYGPHPRHALDVVTSDACRNAPVILFFHGGSWREAKRTTTARSEGNSPRRVVFATANYRLHPEVTFPSFPEDAARAASWVRKEIDSHGGDGENLFLMGHSAGAHSACMVALDPVYLAKWKGISRGSAALSRCPRPTSSIPKKSFYIGPFFPNPWIEIQPCPPTGSDGGTLLPSSSCMGGSTLSSDTN